MNKEKIKKAIKDNIVYKREDTFGNHVASWWNGNGMLSGVVSENSFKVWSCNKFRSGLVHIIVEGTFRTINNQQEIFLKTKVNIAGKIFVTVFLSFWAIFIFGVIRDEKIAVKILLFLAFPVAFILGYSLERERIIGKVEKIIKSA